MKFNKIFMVFLTVILFSGIVFSAAGTPESTTLPASNYLFTINVNLPNPYYGYIVSDASNFANPNSVGTFAIQSSAVTNSKLANNSVTSNKIADYSILPFKIASNAVQTNNIMANAVTSVKIANQSVTENKLANNSVTADKIAFGAVNKDKIGHKAVNVVHIDTDNFPGNGAVLTWDGNNSTLTWSESSNSIFDENSIGLGDLTLDNTVYFNGFDSCVKEVTYTQSGIECKKVGGVHDCVGEFSLGDLILGYNILKTTDFFANNQNNRTDSITIDLVDDFYNLGQQAEVKYILFQPFSDTTITKTQDLTIQSFNCKPQISNFTSEFTDYSGDCPLKFKVKAKIKCVGVCEYTIYQQFSNSSPAWIELKTGTVSSNGLLMDVETQDLDIYQYLDGRKFKIKVTNLSPEALTGLNHSTEYDFEFINPNPNNCNYSS